ncbi:MAG: hypothetical protein AAGE65_03445, partial [Planctomycetota bacterium]
MSFGTAAQQLEPRVVTPENSRRSQIKKGRVMRWPWNMLSLVVGCLVLCGGVVADEVVEVPSPGAVSALADRLDDLEARVQTLEQSGAAKPLADSDSSIPVSSDPKLLQEW